jgi:hypothetical protein
MFSFGGAVICMRLITFIGLLFIFGSVAEAQYTNCRWSIEGTNARFAEDPMYRLPPTIVAATACNGPSNT